VLLLQLLELSGPLHCLLHLCMQGRAALCRYSLQGVQLLLGSRVICL
jgi:hypothetical protein